MRAFSRQDFHINPFLPISDALISRQREIYAEAARRMYLARETRPIDLEELEYAERAEDHSREFLNYLVLNKGR